MVFLPVQSIYGINIRILNFFLFIFHNLQRKGNFSCFYIVEKILLKRLRRMHRERAPQIGSCAFHFAAKKVLTHRGEFVPYVFCSDSQKSPKTLKIVPKNCSECRLIGKNRLMTEKESRNINFYSNKILKLLRMYRK
jgi:hypothetical protein